jgi:hypothetical protein
MREIYQKVGHFKYKVFINKVSKMCHTDQLMLCNVFRCGGIRTLKSPRLEFESPRKAFPNPDRHRRQLMAVLGQWLDSLQFNSLRQFMIRRQHTRLLWKCHSTVRILFWIQWSTIKEPNQDHHQI